MINEQGYCFDVRDDISHISYKYVASGALTLELIVIADKKPIDFCFMCYKYLFGIFPNTYNTKIYRDTNRK